MQTNRYCENEFEMCCRDKSQFIFCTCVAVASQRICYNVQSQSKRGALLSFNYLRYLSSFHHFDMKKYFFSPSYIHQHLTKQICTNTNASDAFLQPPLLHSPDTKCDAYLHWIQLALSSAVDTAPKDNRSSDWNGDPSSLVPSPYYVREAVG